MLFRFIALLICTASLVAGADLRKKPQANLAAVAVSTSGSYSPAVSLLTIPEYLSQRTGSALSSVSISAQWMQLDSVITISGVANTVSAPGWNGVLVYFEFSLPNGLSANSCAGSGSTRLPTTTSALGMMPATGTLYSAGSNSVTFFGGNGFGSPSTIYFTVTCRVV